MATKRNPGKYDCYAHAKPDEPMFVLLARDELAPFVTRIWAMLRMGDPIEKINEYIIAAELVVSHKKSMDPKKYAEALACARDMIEWKMSNPNV